MIQLTTQPIDAAGVLESVRTAEAGAVVVFLGTVRRVTGEQVTESLDYDAYREMAEKKLGELEEEARSQWPISHCAIVHRIGHLELGEASVAVAVSTPHRREAFEAAQWLIDTLKCVVPIWKRENLAGGTSQWIHPGTETTAGHTGDPRR